jgi:hypothetical protein
MNPHRTIRKAIGAALSSILVINYAAFAAEPTTTLTNPQPIATTAPINSTTTQTAAIPYTDSLAPSSALSTATAQSQTVTSTVEYYVPYGDAGIHTYTLFTKVSENEISVHKPDQFPSATVINLLTGEIKPANGSVLEGARDTIRFLKDVKTDIRAAIDTAKNNTESEKNILRNVLDRIDAFADGFERIFYIQGENVSLSKFRNQIEVVYPADIGFDNQRYQINLEKDELVLIIVSASGSKVVYSKNSNPQLFASRLQQALEIAKRAIGFMDISRNVDTPEKVELVLSLIRQEIVPVAVDAFYREIRKAEITRFYQELLGREPDAPGLEGWINSPHSLAVIKGAFLKSQEYYTGLFGRKHWVNEQYRRLLGRSAESAEPWSAVLLNLMNWGVPPETARQYVLNSIRGSAEYQNRGGAIAEEITTYYVDLLGRVPNPLELQFWIQIRKNEPSRNIAQDFRNSPEFGLRARLTVRAELTTLLQRTPYPEEELGFTWQLIVGSQTFATLKDTLLNDAFIRTLVRLRISGAEIVKFDFSSGHRIESFVSKSGTKSVLEVVDYQQRKVERYELEVPLRAGEKITSASVYLNKEVQLYIGTATQFLRRVEVYDSQTGRLSNIPYLNEVQRVKTTDGNHTILFYPGAFMVAQAAVFTVEGNFLGVGRYSGTVPSQPVSLQIYDIYPGVKNISGTIDGKIIVFTLTQTATDPFVDPFLRVEIQRTAANDIVVVSSVDPYQSGPRRFEHRYAAGSVERTYIAGASVVIDLIDRVEVIGHARYSGFGKIVIPGKQVLSVKEFMGPFGDNLYPPPYFEVETLEGTTVRRFVIFGALSKIVSEVTSTLIPISNPSFAYRTIKEPRASWTNLEVIDLRNAKIYKFTILSNMTLTQVYVSAEGIITYKTKDGSGNIETWHHNPSTGLTALLAPSNPSFGFVVDSDPQIGGLRLFVVNVNTGEKELLARNRYEFTNVRDVSPDGKYVVYENPRGKVFIQRIGDPLKQQIVNVEYGLAIGGITWILSGGQVTGVTIKSLSSNVRTIQPLP